MGVPPEQSTAHRVRVMRPEERRPVSEVLARAFHDDPVAAFLFPDETTRLRRYAAFTRFAMEFLAPHGRFLTTEPLAGAALWQAPRPPRPGALRMLYAAVRMAVIARSAFGRAASIGEATERWHPHEPHWYLAVLGTEPAAQGRGLGSALLHETLAECDRTGTLAYLESSKEANLPFYERHGFCVDGELTLPGGPPMWAMRRRPA